MPRGDEARVVAAFREHLLAAGWTVRTEADYCDVLAERNGTRLYSEVKGVTSEPGTDTGILYGQLLTRMPSADDPAARFAAVVPEQTLWAAARVPERVRALLRIDLYAVSLDGAVRLVEAGQ